MDRLNGDRFVAERKITAYLLDTAHPDGGPKARFFLRFGFSVDDPAALLAAIGDHPTNNHVILAEMTDHGIKSVVQCRLVTPDGRDPCIRTIWMLDAGSAVHRFVTAYPAPA